MDPRDGFLEKGAKREWLGQVVWRCASLGGPDGAAQRSLFAALQMGTQRHRPERVGLLQKVVSGFIEGDARAGSRVIEVLLRSAPADDQELRGEVDLGEKTRLRKRANAEHGEGEQDRQKLERPWPQPPRRARRPAGRRGWRDRARDHDVWYATRVSQCPLCLNISTYGTPAPLTLSRYMVAAWLPF